MKFPKQEIQKWVATQKENLIQTYSKILRIPALSPTNGGTGEYDKAQQILRILNDWGWDKMVEVVNIPDNRAKHQIRPNIIITYNPKHLSTPPICVVSHMDIVPVGDKSLWDTNPFDPVVKNGKLFARGSEDNGQGIITSLYALKCIAENQFPIAHPIKIVLVADEETGSKYGIRALIEQGYFSSEDLVLVPDSGNSTGRQIQIAEKTPLRVKITVKGKQAHAARPEDGLNAHRIMNDFATELDQQLHKQFSDTDDLFDSPISTLEPTMRENRVENINTLPGQDILYWDCRLIPAHHPKEVKKVFLKVAQEYEQKTEAKIIVDFIGEAPPKKPIPEDSPLVISLSNAIRSMIPGDINLVGLGGGTCAAFFRYVDIPAVVWGHMDHIAHQANEYCVLEYIYTDIGIYCAFLGEWD